jgi:two-component system KDP operon response regulator KdpE
MKRAEILLIDDDPKLYELLSVYMDLAGYRLLYAIDGNEGLKMVDELHPALVLMDIMMPDMDGWTVTKLLREKYSIPIIIVSAKAAEKDILYGFRLGVDDYVVKPFSFAELVARVGAVLNRSKRAENHSAFVESGELAIDLRRKHVMIEGQKIELTPTEYRLLASLARYANKTIPTDMLLSEVWGPEYAGEIKHVKQFIWSLRKKIEDNPNAPKHLITRRGFGYRFE